MVVGLEDELRVSSKYKTHRLRWFGHQLLQPSLVIHIQSKLQLQLLYLIMKVFVALISVVALWSFSAALPAEEKFQSREIVDEVDPRIFELEYELTPLKSLKKREAEQASDLEAFNLDTEEPLKRTKRNAFFGSGINNNKKSYRLRRFRYQVGSYGQFPHH
ncbi:hypothetical protein TCAL_09362 [Tigriopus californicus]|uniref:Uncharacterized protein n=1 Tax=Tigriopus californicus TaxID=6832 RepID=A0A553PDW1_TIGCA|nr:uncharacterized protein LOC131893284 [Tigriopus californicus]TRY75867.1 hypothetical protein TCAL_09362 [Tigriopus californicus]